MANSLVYSEVQRQVTNRQNANRNTPAQAQQVLTAVDQGTMQYEYQMNQPGPSRIVQQMPQPQPQQQVMVVQRKPMQPTNPAVVMPGHLQQGYQRDFDVRFLGPATSWAQEMEEQSNAEYSESTTSDSDNPIQLEAPHAAQNTQGPVFQPVSPAVVVVQNQSTQPVGSPTDVIQSGNGPTAEPAPDSSQSIPAYQTMQGYTKKHDPNQAPQVSKAHLRKKGRHAERDKKMVELFGNPA